MKNYLCFFSFVFLCSAPVWAPPKLPKAIGGGQAFLKKRFSALSTYPEIGAEVMTFLDSLAGNTRVNDPQQLSGYVGKVFSIIAKDKSIFDCPSFHEMCSQLCDEFMNVFPEVDPRAIVSIFHVFVLQNASMANEDIFGASEHFCNVPREPKKCLKGYVDNIEERCRIIEKRIQAMGFTDFIFLINHSPIQYLIARDAQKMFDFIDNGIKKEVRNGETDFDQLAANSIARTKGVLDQESKKAMEPVFGYGPQADEVLSDFSWEIEKFLTYSYLS